MTQRRDRTDDKDADEQQLTPFQEECKQILSEQLQYGKVVSGKSFGAHLHCYKNRDCDDADGANNEKRNQQKKHEHGETVVLCVDDDVDKQSSSSQSTLASDLRYLSVASRVANTARKRFFVAFRENEDSSKKVENDDESTKKKKGIKMLELTTLTV